MSEVMKKNSRQREEQDFLSRLPYEVIQSLCNYLSCNDLFNLSLTSTYLQPVCSSARDRSVVDILIEMQPHSAERDDLEQRKLFRKHAEALSARVKVGIAVSGFRSRGSFTFRNACELRRWPVIRSIVVLPDVFPEQRDVHQYWHWIDDDYRPNTGCLN